MSPEMGDKVLKRFQVFELEILKNILISYRKHKKLNGLQNENYTRFFMSDSFISNCTRFYKMIKQLHYWQIFGNSTDKQLIAFLSMNKKIIACTNL